MADYKNVEEVVAYKNKDKAKILKYIELCFDKESPLNSIENFRARQIAACKKVSLDPNKEEMLLIMNFQNLKKEF